MANNSRKFRFATKTEVKAETPEVSIDPRNLPHHPGVQKAWVNFNGTGTVAIRTSHNVSSITDNGTGDYTVNFATAFSSADYCASYMTNAGVARVCAINTMAAGSFRFNSHDSSAGNIDTSIILLSFSGDQ